MEEKEAEYSSVHDADIHICIFPHLDEFLVLDVRQREQPKFRMVPAKDLLTPEYYQEVEQEFRRMLHSQDAPFANLVTLPQRLEVFLRRRGLERLAEVVGAKGDSPRLSIFLCGGAFLSLNNQEMDQAMQAFFEGGPPPAFVREYGAAFQGLLGREKAVIKAREAEELRRAVQGRSNEFFTLWQDRPGGPSAN